MSSIQFHKPKRLGGAKRGQRPGQNHGHDPFPQYPGVAVIDSSGAARYYLHDTHGKVISTSDETQNLTAVYQYDANGNQSGGHPFATARGPVTKK